MLRSCDLHAVKRLDQIYLKNGVSDFYYKRRREVVKFALMGCEHTCKSGFCVSMNTNISDDYHFSVKVTDIDIQIDCKDDRLSGIFNGLCEKEQQVKPDHVTENKETVSLPKHLSNDNFNDEIWNYSFDNTSRI